METLWRLRCGRLSHQVLSEYYAIVTQKLAPGLSKEQARSDVRDLLTWKPIVVDSAAMETAWAVQDRFGYSWWDSLIVAAAQKTGCDYLLTEDLQHQQRLDGTTVINPFKTLPSTLLDTAQNDDPLS